MCATVWTQEACLRKQLAYSKPNDTCTITWIIWPPYNKYDTLSMDPFVIAIYKLRKFNRRLINNCYNSEWLQEAAEEAVTGDTGSRQRQLTLTSTFKLSQT